MKDICFKRREQLISLTEFPEREGEKAENRCPASQRLGNPVLKQKALRARQDELPCFSALID
jgi:hypothetical protein